MYYGVIISCRQYFHKKYPVSLKLAVQLKCSNNRTIELVYFAA